MKEERGKERKRENGSKKKERRETGRGRDGRDRKCERERGAEKGTIRDIRPAFTENVAASML